MTGRAVPVEPPPGGLKAGIAYDIEFFTGPNGTLRAVATEAPKMNRHMRRFRRKAALSDHPGPSGRP